MVCRQCAAQVFPRSFSKSARVFRLLQPPCARAQTSVTPVPKSGTKFIREWQGTVHEVLTLENGQFAYRGKTHKSLTLIAKLITGTHQSGPRFFGLRKSSDIKMADHG